MASVSPAAATMMVGSLSLGERVGGEGSRSLDGAAPPHLRAVARDLPPQGRGEPRPRLADVAYSDETVIR